MADYYDELLGSIVVCLVGGALVGLLTPIAFHLGLLLGALTAMVFVCDALFVHPPLPETDRRPTVRSRSITVPRSRSRHPSSIAGNSRNPIAVPYTHTYVICSTQNGPITNWLRRISSYVHPRRSRSSISRSVRRLRRSSPSPIRTS